VNQVNRLEIELDQADLVAIGEQFAERAAARCQREDWFGIVPETEDWTPELSRIVETIPGEKTRVIVLVLRAGGSRPRHSDPVECCRKLPGMFMGFEVGNVANVHVPLDSYPGAYFEDEDEARVDVALGEAIVLDGTRPHAAKNDGDAHRMHLLVDVIVSDELKSLAAGAPAPKKKKTRRSRKKAEPLVFSDE